MAVSNASTKYQTKLRKVKARGYPTLLSLYKKIRNKFDAVFTVTNRNKTLNFKQYHGIISTKSWENETQFNIH